VRESSKEKAPERPRQARNLQDVNIGKDTTAGKRLGVRGEMDVGSCAFTCFMSQTRKERGNGFLQGLLGGRFMAQCVNGHQVLHGEGGRNTVTGRKKDRASELGLASMQYEAECLRRPGAHIRVVLREKHP